MTIRTYFSVDQTAQLTDLSADTLRRWDVDDVFHPSVVSENRRQPMSRLYSVQDVVTLRTLAQAKAFGVAGRELRKIGRFIEDHPETSWTETRIYVVGSRVFFRYTDANRERLLLAANPLGQQAMPEVLTIDLGAIKSDAEQRIQQWLERSPTQLGRTEKNRYVVGGAEVFAGTRIPVAMIAELLRDGWTDTEIFENYPRLVEADLRLAEQFQTNARHVPVG